MNRSSSPIVALLSILGATVPLGAATINADPGNYRSLLGTLQPGDTMVLAAGTYQQGLPIDNMNGAAGQPIAITGPTSGAPAVFEGRSCCNTVSIVDSSWIEIRYLILDGLGLAVDAVKAEGTAAFAHDITLEELTIVNHGTDQQIVGISTKCPAWGWVIRRNVIVGAGTGLYLGDSNGSAPFVGGLVEGNLVQDTIGYNMQVKHQLSRPALPGMPTLATTIVRHNVFSKASGGSTGGNARPNLLVGHFPLSGSGSGDHYEIYGNFFYENPTEALFQGEGNVALYQNLFVNRSGPAIHIQAQNDVPKTIRVFNNTVLATTTGISVSGGDPGYTQEVIGNGVFAATPLSGGTQLDNVTDGYAASIAYLTNPMGAPGTLDLYPLVGTMTGSTLPSGSISSFAEWNLDWNGVLNDGRFRGAYAGEGVNPGWLPKLERKPPPANGDPIVVGQGLGAPNPNRVRVYRSNGSATTVDFLAYAAGAWGVNVAAGDIDTDAFAEVVTGPGPGAVFGPQLRGFLRDGSAMGKVNFYAYGTLKFGVNPATGAIDGDAFEELLSGAGPGAVFGPHVRAFDFDASAVTPIAKVNFFAYSTLKYGVNVAAADVEGDAFGELLTGPGPGVIFGPQVRGFDYDGGPLGAIAKINFNAFTVPQFGCHLAGGDADGDAFDEIVASPGPSASLPARFLGFDYDAASVAAMAGFDVTPFSTMYGGRVGLGDVAADTPPRDELLAGAGRDPAAPATVIPHAYAGGQLTVLGSSFTPFGPGYGVNVTAGPLGF